MEMQRGEKMIDLISRKQAIELLDSAWVDGVEYRGNLHDDFEALPSIYKWTSVKDDMPQEYESVFARLYGTWRWTDAMYLKKSHDVLVVEVYEDGTKRVGVAHTCDGKWKHDVPVIERKVIAWMPLPEP